MTKTDKKISLLNKQLNLTEKKGLIPKSYLHLGYYWGDISKEEFYKGLDYIHLKIKISKLRDHRHNDYISFYPVNLSDQDRAESMWYDLTLKLSTSDHSKLEKLIRDPINYNLDKSSIRQLIRDCKLPLEQL